MQSIWSRDQVLLVAYKNVLTAWRFPFWFLTSQCLTNQTKAKAVVKLFFIHTIFYFSYVTSLHKCQSSSSYVDLSFICTHYIKKVKIIIRLEIQEGREVRKVQQLLRGFFFTVHPLTSSLLHLHFNSFFFLFSFVSLKKRLYWTRHLYQSSGRALDICKALWLYSSRRTQPTGHIQSMVKEE